MVYWADVLYGEPQQELAEHESNDSIIEASDAEADMSWRDNLADAELDWVESLAGKMNFDAAPPSGDDNFCPPPFATTELVVAGFDPKIANDYRQNGNKIVDDVNEQNRGKWRHSISNYLAGSELRGKLQDTLDL